jgi:exopolyphosphatase/pppGpp-phosphohydrolase
MKGLQPSDVLGVNLIISRHICVRSQIARERAVEKWVNRHLGPLEHERRVKEIAGRLFDLTRPLHLLSIADRRTLLLAAMVHDVGRSINDRTHPQQGARMLRGARDLPLHRKQRAELAQLTRLHRGKINLETVRLTRRMLVLLALLRGADGLDSRAIESPKLVMAFRGSRLHITCYLDELTPKAMKVYGRRKKFALLEHMLDCRVDVNLVEGRELRLVA